MGDREAATRTLKELLGQLAPIGRAAGGGYDRAAWTAADAELRAWFRGQAAARGLDVEQDRNGNLWAWWGDRLAGGAVVTGSHLDSVPGGGAFDGPLGVASALVAADLLRARGATPARPLAVVVFADEEGARSGLPTFGSKLLCGDLDPAAARARATGDGLTVAAALAAAGVDPAGIGPDPERLGRIGCAVELHVEQGRGLAGLDAPVALAGGIWPHGRWHVRLDGTADHAGTARLADRHDPMLPLARLVLAARDQAGRAGAAATVGKVTAAPGGTNTVAARADAWLDARAPDDATLDRVVAAVLDATRDDAARHGVTVTAACQSRSRQVLFDPDLRERMARTLKAAGLPAPVLHTAAGHDAGVLAAHVPAGMLFVRNPTGASHTPAEHATLHDCATGVLALAAVLEDLLG